MLHILHFYTKIHAYQLLNQTWGSGSAFLKKPLVSSAWFGLYASGFFSTNFTIFIESFVFAGVEILVHIYRF